jgi:tetratricopeptide (TPR) repeat protein
MTIVGSYIAAKLEEKHGTERLDVYRDGAMFEFFKDYVDLYSNSSQIPDACKFNDDFERTMITWARAWPTVYSEDVKEFLLLPYDDMAEKVDGLLKRFAGSPVYPGLSNKLNALAFNLKRTGGTDKGLDILLSAMELYPGDANLKDSIGEFYLEKGNREKARQYYLMALQQDPTFRSAQLALLKLEPARLADETVDAVPGNYEIEGGMVLTIEETDGELMVIVPGLVSTTLHTLSQTEFLFQAGNDVIFLSLVQDEDGVITGLNLLRRGTHNKGKKVQ